jgi:hypothetical protein
MKRFDGVHVFSKHRPIVILEFAVAGTQQVAELGDCLLI